MPDTFIAYAQEPVPSTWDASVFLAGPTPRDPAVPSWRPGAVDLLRDLWAGFTTNVEWGRWEASGKVVLGAPPDAPKNRYLFHYAQRHGVPTAHTLPATMAAALDLVARRKGTVAP